MKQQNQSRRVAIEFLETRRLLSAGQLDSTFGVGGIVHTPFFAGQTAAAHSIAVESNGKTVVAGTVDTPAGDSIFGVARYNLNGSLDTTFGATGKVTTNMTGFDLALAVKVQSDGKIIVAGSSYGKLAVVRYKVNGSLDTSFGTGGIVTTNFGRLFGDKIGLALQADGKIVVAANDNNQETSHFVLVRYTTAGRLDTHFGTAGIVRTSFPTAVSEALTVGVQSDGKVVASGILTSNDVPIARYQTDGKLDSSFGVGGKASAAVGSFMFAEALVIEHSGRIVVAGDSDNRFTLVGFTPAGKLDASFGNAGAVIQKFPQGNSASNGEATGITIAGSHLAVSGVFNGHAVVAEYSATGQANTQFGMHGEVYTSILTLGPVAVAANPSGKVTIATTDQSTRDFALVRLLG